MGKRILCLICAVVILWAVALGAEAQAWEEAPPNAQSHTERLATGSWNPRPNPLASAMLLVLAGVGISMLFDKKNKH